MLNRKTLNWMWGVPIISLLTLLYIGSRVIPLNSSPFTAGTTQPIQPLSPILRPTSLAPATPTPDHLAQQATASSSSTPFPRQLLEEMFVDAGGEFGWVVYDTTTHQVYAANEDHIFPAASLIKLPIALTVYHLAYNRALDLDQQLILLDEDKLGGSGKLHLQHAGAQYSIRDLCARMLRESDNTASNMLLRRIGFESVNTHMLELGTRDTRVQRRLGDDAARKAGRDNLTSPSDMFLLLQTLYQNAQTNPAGADDILQAMIQSEYRDKLPAALPSDVVVANKTGVLDKVEHDVGIVYLPGRPYMLVVLSQDLSTNQAGTDAIAQASLLVYEWFTQ